VRDTWLVERLNTLINDPEAPAPPESHLAATADGPNALANVLSGVFPRGTGPIALHQRPGQQEEADQPVIDEDLINSTLASYPGGADAFWAGMANSGINREDLLQMLSPNTHPTLRDNILSLPRDGPHPPAASPNSPLFATQGLSSSSGAAPEASLSGQLPPNIHERLAELTAGLPGASSGDGNGATRREYLSLNDALNGDVLARVLQIPGIGEILRHGLPDDWEQRGYNVADAVQSPQFQQVPKPHPSYFVVRLTGIRHSHRCRRRLARDNLPRFYSNLDYRVGLTMLNPF
jgi:hypothetical protein